MRFCPVALRQFCNDSTANDIAEYAMILAMLLALGVAVVRAFA